VVAELLHGCADQETGPGVVVGDQNVHAMTYIDRRGQFAQRSADCPG
jgi:hypothetical protein